MKNETTRISVLPIVSCAFIGWHSIQSCNSSLFISKVLLFNTKPCWQTLSHLPTPGRPGCRYPYFPPLTTDQLQKSHHLTQSPTTAGSSSCASAENHSPVCSTIREPCKKSCFLLIPRLHAITVKSQMFFKTSKNSVFLKTSLLWQCKQHSFYCSTSAWAHTYIHTYIVNF